MPLGRKMMDRLWVGMVMEFWVRLEWLWEGEEEVEGVVIALLEVSLFLSFCFFCFFFYG